METIVVTVTDHRDNFNVLRPVEHFMIGGEKVRVLFHRNPLISLDGGEPEFNFDIMIDNHRSAMGDKLEFRYRHVVPKNRYNSLERLGKTEQAIMLNQAIKNLRVGTHNFLPIKTYRASYTGNVGTDHYSTAKGRVVVKPNDGARGVGHLVVDLEKTNWRVLNNRLGLLTIGLGDWDELISLPGVSYHSISEYSKDEGKQSLLDQGYCIQGLVPNIEAEYRLLTDRDGNIVYIQKRAFKGGEEYPQAIGSNASDSDRIATLADILPAQDVKALRKLAQTTIGAMSSIDLFITKDGKWGIFEYCNQFGTVGVPMDVNRKLHLEYLELAIANYWGVQIQEIKEI